MFPGEAGAKGVTKSLAGGGGGGGRPSRRSSSSVKLPRGDNNRWSENSSASLIEGSLMNKLLLSSSSTPRPVTFHRGLKLTGSRSDLMYWSFGVSSESVITMM